MRLGDIVIGTFKYIGVLLAFIGGTMGYVYAQSEVRTVVVTGKHTEEAHGRRGRTTTRYVIETSEGQLPILKFPVIGYSSGADDVYSAIAPGQSLTVRVGPWPPPLIDTNNSRQHIMAVY